MELSAGTTWVLLIIGLMLSTGPVALVLALMAYKLVHRLDNKLAEHLSIDSRYTDTTLKFHKEQAEGGNKISKPMTMWGPDGNPK